MVVCKGKEKICRIIIFRCGYIRVFCHSLWSLAFIVKLYDGFVWRHPSNLNDTFSLFFFFTNFLFSTISQNFFMFPSRRWLAAMIESFITLINRRNSSWNTSTGWICKTRGTNEKVKIPPHPEDSSKAFKYLNIMFIFHLKLNILKRSSIGCRLSYLVIYRNSLQPYLNQTEFANKP